MALILKDRVKETTTTEGTGTYTLAGAVTGFEAFSAVGDGNTTYYCCTDGTEFEVGIGTYTASGTTLARTTILESSSSDAAVNWTAGTRDIFVTQPAEKAVFLDASNKLDLNGNAIEMGGGSINLDADGNSSISASSNDIIRFEINGTGEYVLGVDELRPFGNEQCQLGSTSRRWSGLFSTNGDFTGDITVSGTVDSRDLATDGTKLDGIEASADVTDTANVTAAGALMESAVTNPDDVKSFDPADYAPAAQTINFQTGTTYTTVLSDAGKLVILSNASAIALTIPPNSSVAYPTGTRIDFIQTGVGQVTVAGGTGVTVNATPTLKFRSHHSAASCIKIATDTWQLVGDLAET